jgi:hypothetical protein
MQLLDPRRAVTTGKLYYQDPDGNKVELQIDNFATVEEGTAFMKSDSFTKNPLGVVFDPTEFIHRRTLGEEVANLVAPFW